MCVCVCVCVCVRERERERETETETETETERGDGFNFTLFYIINFAGIIPLSFIPLYLRLPRWLSGEESTCHCRRHGFDPWVGKTPWNGELQPTQYSCLENPMEREAWLQRVGHDWAHTHTLYIKVSIYMGSFSSVPLVNLSVLHKYYIMLTQYLIFWHLVGQPTHLKLLLP